MKIWDISEPVSPATSVFPGDTPFSAEWILRKSDGAPCNVSTIRMSVHCGSHADAPLHFVENATDIASVDLTCYLGRCRVVDVTGTGEPKSVPVDALGDDVLAGVERILFRTRPGYDHTRFDPDFCSVGPAAADRLVTAGVRLVGIDTPSMDHATSKELPGHHELFRGGIAILENLNLTDVPAGDYELIALPLRIVGGDGSPIRAILRELPASAGENDA